MHNATKAVSFLLKVTSFLKLVVEKLLILMLHFEGYLPTLSPFFPAKEIVLAGTAVFVLAFFFFLGVLHSICSISFFCPTLIYLYIDLLPTEAGLGFRTSTGLACGPGESLWAAGWLQHPAGKVY